VAAFDHDVDLRIELLSGIDCTSAAEDDGVSHGSEDVAHF
jgi:hypothetical protein